MQETKNLKKTNVMNLQIEQKYQFYSEKYDVTFDILKMSNDDVYLNIQQINNLFNNTFDEWLKSYEKYDGCPLEFKAIQYYEQHGYENHKDYLNDIIQIIDDDKYYSIHFLFRYISDNDMNFSQNIYDFYKSL